MSPRRARSTRPAYPLASMEDVDARIIQAVDLVLFARPAYDHRERWARGRFLRSIAAGEAAALAEKEARVRRGRDA